MTSIIYTNTNSSGYIRMVRFLFLFFMFFKTSQIFKMKRKPEKKGLMHTSRKEGKKQSTNNINSTKQTKHEIDKESRKSHFRPEAQEQKH